MLRSFERLAEARLGELLEEGITEDGDVIKRAMAVLGGYDDETESEEEAGV
jgi:hypothetical protein